MTDLAIEVNQLRRAFGKFIAVQDVSFSVKKGEIFGYLGANGAGKSTTIRMLCGLLAPSGGIATVSGCPLGGNTTKLRSRIGYMSQRFSLYMDLSVEANIDFFGGAYGLYGKSLRQRRDTILEQLDLTSLRKATTGELPGGIRQRLALGTAILHKPEIIFLDEPTAGVDPASRRNFWTLIQDLAHEGTTVFVTTHYMDEAEYCARIGLMVSGKLVALDTPRELKKSWVPGAIVNLRGVDITTLQARLTGIDGIHAIEPFGATIHIRFDPNCIRLEALQAAIAMDTQQVTLTPIEASLEDVFLAVVTSTPSPSVSL